MNDDLSELLELDSDERAELDALNRTDNLLDHRALIDALIIESDHPEHLQACAFAERSLCRGELFAAADALAGVLQDLGAHRGTIVAIAMPPGFDRIAAVLAVLRTGAAFMPLDLDHPPERLRFQLSDSGAAVIVTGREPGWSDIAGAIPIVALPLAQPPSVAFRPPLDRASTDWAYVNYTSGSTGKPKAAANTHRALVNRLTWMAVDVSVGRADRILHKTAFGFDVAVWEQLLPLMTGAAMVIAPDGARGDARALIDLIEREKVTLAHFVPTLLETFIHGIDASRCNSLRAVVCSGEALPRKVAAMAADILGCEVRNYYGPTEAAIDVTSWRFNPADSYDFVPIGRPIWNVRTYALGPSLAPVPVGAIGELYIGGAAVGAGYVGRPGLTATRFIPDPFGREPGGRLYRTGDLVRIHSAGFIEFLGRADQQVKLRGYRIELGEIEEVLRQHPDVRQVAVTAAQTVGGQRQLAAYVAATADLEPAQLSVWLAGRLPRWMVPAAIVKLEKLPTTLSGKLDRRALPDPFVSTTSASASTQPSNDVERAIAAVWSRVLKREIADTGLNFFAIGGDSILAIRVVAQCRAADIILEVKDIFEHPTIQKLAAAARRRAPGLRDAATPAERPWIEAGQAARASAAPILVHHLVSHSTDDLAARLGWLAATLAARHPAPVGAMGSYRLHRSDAGDIDQVALALADVVAADRELALVASEIPQRHGEPERTLVIAFDPARLDTGSLPAIAALLRDGVAAAVADHRFDRSLWRTPDIGRIPASLQPQPLGVATLAGDIRRAETHLSPMRHPGPASPIAREHELDRLTAVIARAVLAASKTMAIRLMAPESRRWAARSGYATASLIGRFGLVADGSLDAGALSDAERAQTAIRQLRSGDRDASPAPTGPCVRVIAAPVPSIGDDLPASAGCSVLAATRHGVVCVVIAGNRLVWTWDGSLGDWPAQAAGLAAEFARDHLADRGSHRVAADFPLTGLSDADIATFQAHFNKAVDVYPLAPMQEGMLLHALYWPASDAYLNQNIIELTGSFDAVRFEQAWDATLHRYEILRSGFLTDGLSRPVQYVVPKVERTIDMRDWTDHGSDDIDRRLHDYLAQDRQRPFDLAQAGLFRLAVIRVADDRHLLVWTHHHILLDGWCLPLIWGDVFRHYAHVMDGSPLPSGAVRPFRDFVAWLHHKGVSETDRAFWRDTLEGFGQPTSFSRQPRDQEGSVATHRIIYGEPLSVALRAAAASAGVTTNAMIQTAWALLLGQVTGETDIVHGLSVSGRPPELAGSERMVGLFINALPLRTRLDGRAPLLELVRRTQDALARAGAHAHMPLPEILSQWRGRTSSNDRIFDSLIAFENYPDDDLPQHRVAGIEINDRFCDEKTEYPIGMIVLPGENNEFHFNYDTSHFRQAEIEQLSGDFLYLLESIVERPQSRVAEIATMSREAESRLLAACSTGPAAPPYEDFIRRIEDIADATPEEIAVVSDGRTWTYAELKADIARLAAQLGAEAGGLAAILTERSASCVLGLLASWKAGRTAVLLNPAYPDAMVLTLLANLGVPLVIATAGQATRLGGFAGRVIIPDLTPCPPPGDAQETANECPVPTIAAVLFTSGTTGTPKPVAVTAAGLSNRMSATRALYASTRPRLLANAAPGFDIGLWEFLFPLLQGGTLIIASDDDARDPQRLAALATQWAVDVLHAVPSLAEQIADGASSGRFSQLKIFVVGGETVRPSLVRRLRQKLPAATIWQGYGPTEASISVTDHLCGPDDETARTVPIGRPMAGSRVYVLDRALRPSPVGAIGEIFIAGIALAAGYIGCSRETASAFLPDPFGNAGERMYRTGDRGRWRDDGQLEFVGRANRQVKIRGFRVEPAAVEARLAAHPLVRRAAVAAKPNPSGDLELVAFVLGHDKASDLGKTTSRALQSWLAETLPTWSIPSMITIVDHFPVTSTGKIDVEALAAISAGRDTETLSQPFASPMEQLIAATWTDVTGIALPHRHADFFDHGGHSLTAIRFAAALGRRLGLTRGVPVYLTFKFPTVAGVAEALLAPVEGSGRQYIYPVAEGAGPPLILVHPVEGLTAAYHDLSRHLPGRSIFAIDSPRLDHPEGFATLSAMAALYVEWVRALTNDGPVILGGWSFGGAVALEMARQMSRHGARPIAVVLLDTYNLFGRNDLLPAITKAAPRPESDSPEIAAIAREISRNTVLALSADAPQFDGPTLLVQAQADRELTRDLGPDNGWNRRALPGLEVAPTSTHHHTMLEGSDLMETASAIRAFLERVS
jgi:amino acid adenylation domain-containing protein